VAKLPADIKLTIEQIKCLVNNLNIIMEELLPANSKLFVLMAKGPLDELKQLIDYLEKT
jgi:hypothetical protein